MITSMRINNEVTPTAEDDLCSSHTNDDIAAPYTWLDNHADSDNKPAEEDIDFVYIDNIPTLHDVFEPSSTLSQDDSDDSEQMDESVFWDPGDDMLELQPPALMADSAVPVEIEEPYLDHHSDKGSVPADHHSASSQATMKSMEDVFNLARYEPAQLRSALIVLAWAFQVIAVAALWKAIDDRVIAMALVPAVVYSFIGVVAYLLGMKYLRSYFAELRVTESDWLRSEQVLAAAEDGVILITKFGTAHLIWERLLGVAQDNDHYYFLIAPNQGFMVPKQAVRDPALQIRIDDLASLTRAKAL